MNTPETNGRIPIRTSEDVGRVRQLVRARPIAMGFNLVDQTKLTPAASELARNTLIHGGGGARIDDAGIITEVATVQT